MKTTTLIAAASLILGSGCSLKSGQESVNVSIALSPSTGAGDLLAFLPSPPSSIDGFTCLAVDVSGSDLPGSSNGSCGPAVTSKMISPLQADPVSIALRVPSGPNRKFKMIGIVKPGLDCGQYTNLQAMLQASSAQGSYPDLYLLGSTSQDLFRDTQVEIPNQYNSANTAAPYSNCSTGASLSLFLSAAYGSYTNSDYAFATNATVATPPVSYSTTFASAILDNFRNPSNTISEYLSSNSGSAAMDFYFALPPEALSGYTKARLVGSAAGGNKQMPSCIGTDPDTNGGLKIRMAAGTSGWVVPVEGADFTSFNYTNFTLNFNLNPASNKIAATGAISGDYLVISLRASTAVGPDCSRLAMRRASLELIP